MLQLYSILGENVPPLATMVAAGHIAYYLSHPFVTL